MFLNLERKECFVNDRLLYAHRNNSNRRVEVKLSNGREVRGALEQVARLRELQQMARDTDSPANHVAKTARGKKRGIGELDMRGGMATALVPRTDSKRMKMSTSAEATLDQKKWTAKKEAAALHRKMISKEIPIMGYRIVPAPLIPEP